MLIYCLIAASVMEVVSSSSTEMVSMPMMLWYLASMDMCWKLPSASALSHSVKEGQSALSKQNYQNCKN